MSNKTRMERRKVWVRIGTCAVTVLALMAATTIVCARVEVLRNMEHEESEEYRMYLEAQEPTTPETWAELSEALADEVPEDAEAPYESERIEEAIFDLSNKRYELTTEEFYLVCGIVAHEAESEPYEGKMAVAQTILNQCEYENARPADVAWKFAEPWQTWSDEVWSAVTAVFFEGQTVTDETILWFYNPARGGSDFHESQRFVMEIGKHRFFAEGEGK